MRLLFLALCLSSAAAFLNGPVQLGSQASLRRSVSLKNSGIRAAKLTLSEKAPAQAVDGESVAARISRVVMDQRPNQPVTNRKIVIITGASSGIGLEAAAQLANKVKPFPPINLYAHDDA